MTGTGRLKAAQAELRHAVDAARATRALLELGLTNDAASRAYYAVFHAACAVLAMLDLETRTHRAALKLFSEHVVRAGHAADEYHEILGELMDLRHAADYDRDVEVTLDEAQSATQQAERFVDEMQRVLVRLGYNDQADA